MQHESDEEQCLTAHPEHQISLVDRGPFLGSRCSCGWNGPARRSRPLARHEAAAHVLAHTA